VANQTDGKGRIQQAEAEAAQAEAAREVETAQAAYDDMRPLLERGFVTRLELQRAEQTLTRAREQLDLARLRREAVMGFERPAATARSKADLDAAEQALARQQQSVLARAAQHEAAVRIAASRVDEIAARTALLRDQIARCVVRSDAAGMVVYRELYFGNDRRKPQVGDEVWSSQPLIALPDTGQLTVETRIREIDLHKVKAGGRVAVTLPAYPGLALRGSIAVIGALAEVDPARAGSKFFPVTVAIEGADERLRTGMTAKVDIEVAALPSATLVPVQAIFAVQDHPSVFVVDHERISTRPIVVTAENERDAAIGSGVGPGQIILLADPREPSSGEGARP
jgi:multidrug resistance efflux pump